MDVHQEIYYWDVQVLWDSYLYLSEDKNTTLYEVKASYLDELSVGTFQLQKDNPPVKIVDFTENTSLYQSDDIKNNSR